MKEGADVSKAEHNAPGNGLTGVPTAEKAIWIAHDPAHTHNVFSGVQQIRCIYEAHQCHRDSNFAMLRSRTSVGC